MVLGQYMAILAGTWWYWVIISWYCLVLGGIVRAFTVTDMLLTDRLKDNKI